MRDHAGREPPPALHDLHRQLLDQRWECWQMTASRGTEEDLDVAATFIAAVLRRVAEPNTLEHYARVVARMLCLDTAARLARGPLYLPIFAEQRVCILRHLHELCRRGLLVRTASSAQQSDRGARS